MIPSKLDTFMPPLCRVADGKVAEICSLLSFYTYNLCLFHKRSLLNCLLPKIHKGIKNKHNLLEIIPRRWQANCNSGDLVAIGGLQVTAKTC